jgi:hypothetical protein
MEPNRAPIASYRGKERVFDLVVSADPINQNRALIAPYRGKEMVFEVGGSAEPLSQEESLSRHIAETRFGFQWTGPNLHCRCRMQ